LIDWSIIKIFPTFPRVVPGTLVQQVASPLLVANVKCPPFGTTRLHLGKVPCMVLKCQRWYTEASQIRNFIHKHTCIEYCYEFLPYKLSLHEFCVLLILSQTNTHAWCFVIVYAALSSHLYLTKENYRYDCTSMAMCFSIYHSTHLMTEAFPTSQLWLGTFPTYYFPSLTSSNAKHFWSSAHKPHISMTHMLSGPDSHISWLGELSRETGSFLEAIPTLRHLPVT
jgi:hypothetical protein